jgi:peptide chain release factor subunit 3
LIVLQFSLSIVEGQKIVALIEAVQPVCVERFADYPQLGRFTLRDEGRTIAIGKVCPIHLIQSFPNLDSQITKLIENTSVDDVAEGVANVSVNG